MEAGDTTGVVEGEDGNGVGKYKVIMSTRLFIGNLPPRLCFPELEALFAEVGKVQEADLVTDSITGRSRGFGFVEMASDEEAQAAIAKYHGYELDGQSLVVNEAKPQRGSAPRGGERPPPGRDRSTAGSEYRPPSSARGGDTRLYVGNLPYTVTTKDLEELFAEAGAVASVSLVMDRASGQSKGFAFVEMASKEEAKTASERFNGYDLKGRVLKVNEARPQGERFGGGRPSFGGGGARRW